MTECSQLNFDFQPIQPREVRGGFSGGSITSDAGALLLREVELRTGIVKQFAACFKDHRDPGLIEHTLETLLAQRVVGLALGYEDLNDHDQLRADPLLAVVVNHSDPQGTQRHKARDRGKPLAGKSTLNRLELTPATADASSRYKKIVYDRSAIEELFVELFLQAHTARHPRSSWTWTPLMIRFTATSRAASFTAITGSTATCRCTSSAVSICCARGCARRTLTPRLAR